MARRIAKSGRRPAGTERSGISRRRMLKGAAAAAGLAVGSGAIKGFPTIWAQSRLSEIQWIRFPMPHPGRFFCSMQ